MCLVISINTPLHDNLSYEPSKLLGTELRSPSMDIRYKVVFLPLPNNYAGYIALLIGT